MTFTNYALDTFVAQQLSSVVWSPQPLGDEFPARLTWLQEFVLRRLFQAHVADQMAPLAFIMIRRAQAAINEWDLMCATPIGQIRNPAHYFAALQHCEACIAASWQALDFGRKALGMELFAPSDGSVYERMNEIYNTGRHFNPGALPAGALHAVWLAGSCVRTARSSLELSELRNEVAMLGRIAQRTVAGPEPAV